MERDVPPALEPRDVLRRGPKDLRKGLLRAAAGFTNFGDASPYVPDNILRAKAHVPRVGFPSGPKKGTMSL